MFDLVTFGRNKNLWNTLEDIEKEVFQKGFFSADYFRTDVLDQGDHYMLEAELPGFRKEDIHVDIEDSHLTIHAESISEKDEEEKNYVRRERSQRSFSRRFNITDVKEGEISAEYEHGILKVKLPKKEEAKPSKHSIEIN